MKHFSLATVKMKSATNPSIPFVRQMEQKVLNGENITRSEAVALAQTTPKQALYDASHRLTQHFCGNRFDTCSIINVKSGNCPEDCKWCAQSKHFVTGCDCHGLLGEQVCVEQACYNQKQGIKRFSLVATGRTQSLAEIEHIANIYKAINKHSHVKCCASLGLLNEQKLQMLYEAGVTTYHCNMESAPRFFPTLVTTHTQQQKIETIKVARKVGMRICSGGIIGMGETEIDRIDFAFFLHSLGIESIPINILHPISGTPLEHTPPLTEQQYLTTVALFRFICPTAFLRFSGGRIQVPLSVMQKAMYIGINSAITGDMLTTVGVRAEEDMAMIRKMGYNTQLNTDWEVIEKDNHDA